MAITIFIILKSIKQEKYINFLQILDLPQNLYFKLIFITFMILNSLYK